MLHLSMFIQPDIVYVSKERLSIIKKHIHGVPDLVVEILSEGTMNDNLNRKKDLYERFEIKEFWSVNANTKEAVGFENIHGKYIEFYRNIGILSSKLLNHSFEF